MIGKRRLLLAAGTLASIGAVVALATGVTFGFFTATATSNTSTFSSGTIALTSSTSTSCTYGNPQLEPGDAISSCHLGATYSGSLPAWTALDVQISYPTADVSLYGGDNVNGLTFSITGGNTKAFTVPTGTPITGTGTNGCAAATTCWNADNLLAQTDSTSSPDATSTTFNNGDTVSWTVQPSFPTTVGNAFQGGTAKLTLTAHSTQTRNNGVLTSCTVGKECDTTTLPDAGPAWS